MESNFHLLQLKKNGLTSCVIARSPLMWCTRAMNSDIKLQVRFWKTPTGNEPVREWLKSLSKHDCSVIGHDIQSVQFRWPLGMPIVRKIEAGLWAVRVNLTGSKIARIFFTLFEGNMVLLHGFIKKSKKTPDNDLNLARSRK